MKYIDSDKLKERVTRLIASARKNDWPIAEDYLRRVIDIIDSLQKEQPEVDLEKDLDQWRHKHFKGKRDDDYSGEYLERESQLDLARHFYELGLNARKGIE